MSSISESLKLPLGEVKYRPGRIQSLTPEQEISVKQTWAYLLKYWGYDVKIPIEDLTFRESFIASTPSIFSSTPLKRSQTRDSFASGTSSINHTPKRRSKLFGRKKACATQSVNSKRLKEIQLLGHENSYQKLTAPTDTTRYIYTHHYRQGFEYSPEYATSSFEESKESFPDSDIDTFESYTTACTSINEPLSRPTSTIRTGNLPGPNSKDTQKAPKKIPSIIKGNMNCHAPDFPQLNKYKPGDLHNAFYQSCRQDCIDNYLLRFVRARKWNTHDALAMFSNSLNWRQNVYPSYDWLLEGDAKSYLNDTNPGFVKNYTAGKCRIRGKDRQGNPVFYFESRKHFASDATPQEMERFALTTIEWFRLYLRDITESTDTATVVFDLSGFSLKNADNPTTKFLAEVFEAHYPEFLNNIVIHKAPWIFSTIWNIIKNWLDPVVSSKIHFTKDINEIGVFIDPKHLPSRIDGEDVDEIEYTPPSKNGDKPPLAKNMNYHNLRIERDEFLMLFFDTTIKWIEAVNPDESAAYYKDKLDLNYRLAHNYVQLDSYTRIPGVFDRDGHLKLGY